MVKEEMGKKEHVTEEMTTGKIRLYTNIPPNALLVGHNIFTKNPKIYSKALFHMPWFESRFVSLETQNLDLPEKRYEVDGKGIEIVVDAAVSYKVKPLENTVRGSNGRNHEYGIIDRWKNYINGFRNKTVTSIIKTVAITAATVASAFVIGPFCLAIPVVSAGYISFFSQDPEDVKNQGAYKAVYNRTAAIKELEQIIYNGLREYYATHSYEEIRKEQVKISNIVPDEILRNYEDEFGIVVSKINIKSADLTEASNEVLRKQREAEVRAETIKVEAEAQKEATRLRAEALEELIDKLQAKGLSSDQIANYLKAVELSKGNGTIITDTSSNTPATYFAAGGASTENDKGRTK